MQSNNTVTWEPALSRRGLNQIKPAYHTISARWPAQLTVSTFNRLGQYASSFGYRAYCHTELAVFFLVVARRPLPVLIPSIQEGWPG